MSSNDRGEIGLAVKECSLQPGILAFFKFPQLGQNALFLWLAAGILTAHRFRSRAACWCGLRTAVHWCWSTAWCGGRSRSTTWCRSRCRCRTAGDGCGSRITRFRATTLVPDRCLFVRHFLHWDWRQFHRRCRHDVRCHRWFHHILSE